MPDVATLRQLKVSGMTYEEIAARYGVTASGDWRAFERAGLVKRRATYRDICPWIIDREHSQTVIMAHLRTMAKLESDPPAPSSSIASLNNWIRYLAERNLVVTYSLDAPPSEVSETGGFSYEPRIESDESFFRA